MLEVRVPDELEIGEELGMVEELDIDEVLVMVEEPVKIELEAYAVLELTELTALVV